MTEDEIEAASCALIAWCKSQGLSPHDGARVMTYTLAGIMRATAEQDGCDLRSIDEIRLILNPERPPH